MKVRPDLRLMYTDSDINNDPELVGWFFGLGATTVEE